MGLLPMGINWSPKHVDRVKILIEMKRFFDHKLELHRAGLKVFCEAKKAPASTFSSSYFIIQ